MKPLVALFMVLAVYRGTVLVLKDYIAEPVRRCMRESGRRPLWCRKHLEYLSNCPWCSSFWVACVIVPLTVFVSWWWIIDAILASSAVTGILLDSHKP